MRMEQVMQVKGVAFFDGTVEGTEYKTGTVFIDEPLDESKNNAKGSRSVAYPATDSEVIKRIFNQQFPLTAKVVIETQTMKKTQRLVVSSVVPVEIKPAGATR